MTSGGASFWIGTTPETDYPRLTDEIEVDIVEAISNLTSRQISLEASLRATAQILQLSLLNFI